MNNPINSHEYKLKYCNKFPEMERESEVGGLLVTVLRIFSLVTPGTVDIIQ